MLYEIVMKVFKPALQWFGGARRMGAERISRAKEFSLEIQQIQVFHFTLAFFDSCEHFNHPWKAFTARRAPATAFKGKKLFYIMDE
jgi:hypothetical protein